MLATVDGDVADARTVVLREVDSHRRSLRIYSDERAGKVAQLRRRPNAMLVMWSGEIGWQLRCRVHLTLEKPGPVVSCAWARIKSTPAAQDYLSPLPPGSPLTAADVPGHAAVTQDHFAVIDAAVQAIDWLELHADGHRRAIFDAAGARWVQP